MSVAHQGGVDRTGQVQSLLYVAFVKILRLLRLGRRDNEELAIKVVMLRHEVAVRWPDRCCSPRVEHCSPG
jgi:hypothetical protein